MESVKSESNRNSRVNNMTVSIERFYAEFGGDKLVDSSNYPPEIVEYLQQEEHLTRQIMIRYEYGYFIEVGCMDARSLWLAISLNVPYYGIDIVDKYIERARAKINALRKEQSSLIAEVAEASVYDLSLHLSRHFALQRVISQPRPLVIFPFNSFGNISDPQRASEAVKQCKMDFLILTYKTDEPSTQVRNKYYQNCGYTGLLPTRDDKGVRFSSLEGLDTSAYEESYLGSIFSPEFFLTAYAFSQVGIAYHGIRQKVD